MISVIIPTLNERQNIRRCIESVLSEGCGTQIIVCDGESADGTQEIVREYRDRGVELRETRRGRGSQMNGGAFAAGREVLLFLHADTRLEKGWHDAATRALQNEGCAGGAFALRIDSPRKQFRLIETWVRLRCRIFRLPYGDQALFMRKKNFMEIGGYRDIALMEDVDIIKRLKTTGTIVMLSEKAVTSARRWEREGWIRTSVRNQLIMLLYRMGMDPQRLVRMYYR